MNDAWVNVGRVHDVDESKMLPVQVQDERLFLIKVQDQILCFKDQCTHQPVPLTEFGEVKGRFLVCHAHGACFDLLKNGCSLGFPATQPLEQIDLRIENDLILIKL